ncbi:EAL domain-containing protein [Paenibacillus sp. TRM 82003]|nr:EAL domain-containing protein [Paenibacillus sp. TRM 82003]
MESIELMEQDALRREVESLRRERDELRSRLKATEAKYTQILDALPINIFLEDAEGRTIFANRQTCEANGMQREEVIGKTVFDLFPRDIAEKLRQDDMVVWRERELSTKEEVTGFRGVTTHMLTGKTILHLEDEAGQDLLLGFALDITDRVTAERRAERMAYEDALTGLPNRWFIHSYLERSIASTEGAASPFAMLLLDLDHFKVINDSLGHQAGDDLLRGVAARLTDALGEERVLARLGGDEFLVIAPGLASGAEAERVAACVVAALAEPFELEGHRFAVTTSVGISLYPRDGRDIHTLIKNADIAMYRSKAKGRNGYQSFEVEMKLTANDRLHTEILLREALEQDQLLLHYQPKREMKSGRIYGVEALIRWAHPTRGLLFPSAFLDIAEETGLIVPIGEWVIRTACVHCKAWHDAGFGDLTVSVNLSASQFQKQDLEAVIAEALAASGLPPGALELELTESVVMKRPIEAAKTLEKLKSLGVALAIDDFGTGFSSLSYLNRFPIDTLKIDKSFLPEASRIDANAAISGAIISLAHSLRFSVVAEGVESEEQLAFLKSRNCDSVQGFFIARPLEAERVEAYLASVRGA